MDYSILRPYVIVFKNRDKDVLYIKGMTSGGPCACFNNYRRVKLLFEKHRLEETFIVLWHKIYPSCKIFKVFPIYPSKLKFLKAKENPLELIIFFPKTFSRGRIISNLVHMLRFMPTF